MKIKVVQLVGKFYIYYSKIININNNTKSNNNIINNILFYYIYFRYKDFDDIGEFMARSKSRMSICSGIDDLYYNSKVKFPESDSSHVLI